MLLSADFKRAQLTRIYRQVVPGTRPLLTLIQEEADARAEAVAPGRSILSTSAGSHGVTFATPGNGSIGEDTMSALWAEMERRYASALAELGGTPTDAQIYATMMGRLYPVRSYSTQYTSLRNLSTA